MNKERIRFFTQEDMIDFVEACSRYKGDVNIYDGDSVTLDAKSIVGVLNLPLGKFVSVKLISSNEDEIVNFIKDMKRFEV